MTSVFFLPPFHFLIFFFILLCLRPSHPLGIRLSLPCRSQVMVLFSFFRNCFDLMKLVSSGGRFGAVAPFVGPEVGSSDSR